MYCWFWKCGILIFYGKITLWAIWRDTLRGPRLFWPLNCPERSEGQFSVQKSQGSLKISQEMAHKLICPKTKNNIQNFQNQPYIGKFMSHCDQLPTILNLLHLHIKLSLYVYQLSWHGTEFWLLTDLYFRRFFLKCGTWSRGEITLCTANVLYVPLTRKMRDIRKLGMNLLGT
jgi:hypothetical protein